MSEIGALGYALGHSKREMDRLSAQAVAFEPFTRRMLIEAGLKEGMRVLDVGSGTGDVSFLAASIVGPKGHVTGVDKGEAAVETARERAAEAGLDNVAFLLANASEVSFTARFDAVIGRLVLMHQPDPVATLRHVCLMLRPGGVIAFQEIDIRGARSDPRAEIFEQCLEWIAAVLSKTGSDVCMGLKLYSTFVAAGLPGPGMSLDANVGGGEGNPASILIPDLVRTLLPGLEKFGIATAAEIGIDSLRDRIDAEVLAGGGVAVGPLLVSAWTKLA